ncbi:MAG: hypothetical protein B5766_01185 [Candidatus Lumbricidophila eiseniae]|uniref:DNA helicase n=1 Tax=Candidatus Lumbricidiphila eiseniae TaxID=1969409 RepID=A0A2A6FUP3_9MICO|nr:MAG: hypothetical protein B5766_01185 [Candidatus Lumbricidophila eiseniae]
MSLSRSQRKELQELRDSAGELWSNQQIVLEHAGAVASAAGRQLRALAQQEVVPRVRTGFDTYVRPGLGQAGRAAHVVGEGVEQTVGRVIGAAMSIGDIAQDARVQRAVRRFAPRAVTVAPPAKKKSSGAGAFLAVSAGLIAAAGVAYAIWQTFRADDELWVEDDTTDPTSSDS